MSNYDTLEKAQERIVELEAELADKTDELVTLSQKNETLETEKEELREMNQRYFNRLIQQKTEPDPDEESDEDTVPTCEEFAKQINIF